MIKKYCDVCGREIDKYADTKRQFYFTRGFETDLCLDCNDKWEEVKTQLRNKYDKLYDKLQREEREEINQFFGKDVFGGKEDD